MGETELVTLPTGALRNDMALRGITSMLGYLGQVVTSLGF